MYMKKQFYYFVFSFLTVFVSNAQHNWTRTNPGGGGAIACVKADPNGVIYVASDLSGVYKSTDNGQSFTVLGANQGLIETHVSAFGFNPNNSQVFFAGTYIGLYRTDDGGNLFTPVFPSASDSFDYSYIEDVAIAASNSNIGYVTHHLTREAAGEVYKTTDGGLHWNAIPNNNFPNNVHLIKIMIHPTGENIVYVLTGKSRWGCSEANLYRTTDGGVNWTEIGSNQGDILDMDLHPTNPDIVYISTFESNFVINNGCSGDYIGGDENSGALYKSVNGGTTFNQIGDYTGIISVGINNPNIIRVVDVLFPYDWNDNAGTWETLDGGATWTHKSTPSDWNVGYSLNQYFTFVPSFNGLNKTVTKDIFNSDKYYGSFGQWAWASFDGGGTINNVSTKEITTGKWLSTGVENVNGHCIEVNQNNPNIIYIGTYDMGFWRSLNHGQSWERFQPNYNTYSQYSWDIGTPGTIPNDIAIRGTGSNVLNILSDPNREAVVWATFSRGQFTDSSEEEGIAKTGLFKSFDYGETWQLITNGLPNFDNTIRVYGLSLDKNSSVNNRKMFMTVDGTVYRSVDDGISWTSVLTGINLKFTEVDKLNGNIVYAGGKDGLWKSTSSGDVGTWIEVGTADMHNTHINTRPDIVPTYMNWGTNPETYAYEGVFDIETDPNVAGRVYVTVQGTNKGLYKFNESTNSWEHLITDDDMRSVAVTPQNSNIVYATSSKSYHSGGFGNSLGVLYSTDAGANWTPANDGMAFNYAGSIQIETGQHPYVWCWSPGTGVQKAKVPYFENLSTLNHLNTQDLLYPNPVEKIITVPEKLINGYYTIYSINGKKIINSKTTYQTIDVEGLKSGVYLLKFTKENKNYNYKFVKK